MQKATIPQTIEKRVVSVGRDREFQFTYSAKYNQTNIEV